MPTLFMFLLPVIVALVYSKWPEIARWYAKGCAACLILADLDDSTSSRSWAHAATPHTCWRKNKHAAMFNADGAE